MKEKILHFIKFRGPVLPSDLSREFKRDSLIMGAYLSEMTSNRELKITNVKVGSSPAYYIPGQESKIEYLSKYLNEKNLRAFNMLKDKKVLKDEALDPLTKVCLRNIKDYAIPLRVNKKEIFWKYFLTPSDEAQSIIKLILGIKEEEIKEKVVENLIPKKKIKNVEPVIQKKEPEIKEPKKEVVREIIERSVEKIESIPKEIPKEVKEDNFFDKVKEYCEANNIKIISYEIIKNDRDIELILSVPTAIGQMQYFAKARNKKKCNEGDLSSAYMKGQNKNLPILFISTGEIPKKTEEKLGNEFKQLVFKKLE